MPRKVERRLDDKTIKSKKGNSRLGDGDGLSLVTKVSPTTKKETRSWIFTYGPASHRVGLTLGRYDLGMSLSIARERAREMRELLAKGVDPREARKAEKLAKAAEQSFGQYADTWLPDHLGTIKNAKDKKNRAASLSDSHIPGLRKVAIGAVTDADIVAALRKRWTDTPSTAEKMLGVIRKCLDEAIDDNLHPGPNPANSRLLRKTQAKGGLGPLGKEKSVSLRDESGEIVRDVAGKAVTSRVPRGNMKAIRLKELPAFYAQLGERAAESADALQLLCLTGARTNEVRLTTWDHIDFEKATWTRPAEIMKTGKPHTVPLSAPALAILKDRYDRRKGSLIFPSIGDPEKPFSENALTTLARVRMKRNDLTPHGMRAVLRTWLAEETDCPFAIAEMCIAHDFGDETVQAYNRGEALDKRRVYMDRWAELVTKPKVVSLDGRRRHG